MRIIVRPDSPVAIYEQIVSQVVFAVAAGDVRAGDEVPSVRELAQNIVVNPNTVARAYQELEKVGVLDSRRGQNMVVAADGPKRCRERRREIVRGRVREALREAASAGLSADDVHGIVDDEWPRLAAARNGQTKSTR
jgi:GntR family transcriptional regulator